MKQPFDALAVQSDIVRHMRGTRTQTELSSLMGYSFNQSTRWETGRTAMSWEQLVRLDDISGKQLGPATQKAFSYAGSVQDVSELMRFWIGNQKRSEFAQALGVSEATISRWLTGNLVPTVPQMLDVMFKRSVDFFRFLHFLIGSDNVESLKLQMDFQTAFLQLYSTYPWLSILLSGIDLIQYKENPSVRFLAEKCRLKTEDIKSAIADLQNIGALNFNGKHWESNLDRISQRVTVETRKLIAADVFSRTVAGMESGLQRSDCRFSWKQFSIKQSAVPRFLQKYTEMYNELGDIIDEEQEGADSIYQFSVCLLHLDALPQAALTAKEE